MSDGDVVLTHRYWWDMAVIRAWSIWYWARPSMILAGHPGETKCWRWGRRYATYSAIVDYVIALQGDEDWAYPPVIAAIPLTHRAEQRGWRLLASDFT